MTFLSITQDTLAGPAATRPVARVGRRRTLPLAQVLAFAVVVAGLTVPGTVAQAKWSKLNLIVTFMHHRCLVALTV